MRIPKELKERVYEIVFYKASEDFEEDTYEVNLEDGWTFEGSGLHYCSTAAEVMEVIKGANQGTITAEFYTGKKVDYTYQILPLLMNDSEVIHILDNTTGELLK